MSFADIQNKITIDNQFSSAHKAAILDAMRTAYVKASVGRISAGLQPWRCMHATAGARHMQENTMTGSGIDHAVLDSPNVLRHGFRGDAMDDVA
jgi:hypothetical protein